MRILAVDHGELRIGIALSDPAGSLARPLVILAHKSRPDDARRVIDLAREHDAEEIVVGDSVDEEGLPNSAGRRARRFADALRESSNMRVVMWDESFSSQDVLRLRIAGGAPRKRRAAKLDAAAAALILQSYLDSRRTQPATDEG